MDLPQLHTVLHILSLPKRWELWECSLDRVKLCEPTVMHERGDATQYPRGMEDISTAKTLALEHQVNTLFICFLSFFVSSFFAGRNRIHRHLALV